MKTLDEIRAKLKAAESKTGQQDNSIFPFWNMQDGETSIVRFLPDGDDSNDFFWVERQMIRLPFPGIKDQADSSNIIVQVPCMEMYGETCPILAEVRPWFKDSSMEELARSYWKKRSYIFQGLIVSTKLVEENVPENPVRRTILGPQIYKIVYNGLLNPEMEHLPTDYENGTDFRFTKDNSGQFANYSGSNWARKERALTDVEQEAVEKFGLFNLSDFLPSKPSPSDVVLIQEMFEASVNHELFDVGKWGTFYRPPNNTQSSSTVTSTVETKPAPLVTREDETDPPFETDESVKEKGTAPEDILELIRTRQNSS